MHLIKLNRIFQVMLLEEGLQDFLFFSPFPPLFKTEEVILLKFTSAEEKYPGTKPPFLQVEKKANTTNKEKIQHQSYIVPLDMKSIKMKHKYFLPFSLLTQLIETDRISSVFTKMHSESSQNAVIVNLYTFNKILPNHNLQKQIYFSQEHKS